MPVKIIKKIIFPLLGKKKFQPFFEWLNLFSLIGMNISVGADPKDSGEKNALTYINNHYIRLNNIIIFDVGANIGHYTTLIKSIFGEKASIHSFEPSKNTFDKLSSNLENKTKIDLHNFGFGNENKNLLLYSNSDESGLASIYKRRLDHFNVEMTPREQIEIKTVDDFCDDFKIDHVHFLKIDVEGHELKVLEGASRMIKSNAIDFIQFEFGGTDIDSRTFFQDFFYLLKDKYDIYRIVKDGLYLIGQYKETYEVFLATNYLAKRKKI